MPSEPTLDDCAAPLGSITAYDEGAIDAEPRRHFHCAICGEREVFGGLTREEWSAAATAFVDAHRYHMEATSAAARSASLAP